MNNEDKVIKALLKAEPQHIRQLSRNTDLHPNTIISTTKKLYEQGILEIEKGEKTVIGFADTLKAKNRKVMFCIELLIDVGILDYFDQELAFPTIILFGSMSKGTGNNSSDVDLCIITEVKKEIDLKRFEKLIGREIQLLRFTKTQWNDLDLELKSNIANGIVLGGYMEI